MRSFSKKLAFVLAAAMVVTAFAPAAKAEAAKEMAINKSSQILYVNEGINHKGGEVAAPGKGNVSVYDFSVKNKPADWKTAYSFAWSSSDEDVVSVAKGGVATAVGVGKATVYCKVTEKATKEVTTLKTKVTVKANAYEVEITNADKWDGATVEVNGVVDLNRAMYDEDGNKTTKRGTLVTDYTKWVAEPAAGVEIDQKTGKFTFTEAAVAGEYKLSCYTYQSSKYTEKTAESDVVMVEFVKAATLDIKQTTRTKFQLDFSKATNVAAADVTVNRVIVGADGSKTLANCLVKGVTLNDAKTSATVELYVDFVDGVEYQITVKGFDMQTMTASVGTPASIVLSSSQYYITNEIVANGTPVEICARLYDANGVDVTASEKGNENLSYKITKTSNGYTYDASTGKTLFFSNVGDTAVVEATYHTGKYDSQANEIGKIVSTPFTFVGVEKSYVGITGVLRAGLDGEWNGTKLKVEDGAKTLGVKFTLADGNESSYHDMFEQEIADKWGNSLGVGKLLFKSLNTNVLQIEKGSHKVNGQNVDDYKVIPYNPGTAMIVVYGVKDSQEIALASFPVEVQANATLASAGFWNNYVVVSNDADASVGSTVDINGYVKDQYNKDYAKYYISNKTGDSDLAQKAINNGALTTDGAKVTVNLTVLKNIIAKLDASSMSFKFNITFKNTQYPNNEVVTSFVVEMIKKSDAASATTYDIEVSGLNGITDVSRSVTLYDGSDNTEKAKSATFTLFEMNNGAKYAIQDFVAAPSSVDKKDDVTGKYIVQKGQFYYKLTRDSQVITADAVTSGAVTVNFTGSEKKTVYMDNGSQTTINVVNKKGINGENRGEGLYELTVFRGVGEGAWEVVASESLAVTFNPGTYSVDGLRAIKASDNWYGNIIKCFNIKNKDGGYNADNGFWFNDAIKRYYNIAMDTNAQTSKTVFVQSISFFEQIPDTDMYVEYTIYGVNQSINY